MMEHEAIVRALKGDQEATDFCLRFYRVTQIWDDLIDKDRPVDAESINWAFWQCLIEIPGNKFYKKHADILQPLLAAFIMDWFDANRLEKQDDHGRNIAFVLRDSVGGLVIQCARIIGGMEWARDISVGLRRGFINDERLSEYKAKLSGEE